MFKGLAALLLAYVAYGVTVGEVYVKRGPGGANVKRAEQPFRYWSGIVVYAALAAALFFVF